MDAVELAVLSHLDPFTIVVAVLHRDVVPLLADLALECHFDPAVVLRHFGSSFFAVISPSADRPERWWAFSLYVLWQIAVLLWSVAAAGLEPATPRL
jgi:hypothetical protein